MPDEIRVSRPMPQGQGGMGSMGGEMRQSSMGGGMGGRSSRTPWIILVVVIIVLIVLGVLFRDKLGLGGSTINTKGSTTTKTDKASGYQAVFLTNGQVYFGKLSHTDGQYATLTDIYYLQVTQPPGLQGSQNQANAASQQQQQLSLVKLGQELHGPVDSMQINRDQILFYEDMKDDGKVAQAIHQYQQNPPANNTNTNSNTPAPATNTPVNK